MNLCVLGSGSRGNAIAVWSGKMGILVDLGLSYKQMIARMEARGIDPQIFQAALITHAHKDHITSTRKWIEDHGLEIWCTPATKQNIEPLGFYQSQWRRIGLTHKQRVAGFDVWSTPTRHNAEGACTFIIEHPDSKKKLAIFAETGVVTPEMFRLGRHAHAYIIEANHDKELCATNDDRPDRVNERTLVTHLSNSQAAKLIEYLDDTAEVVILVHLSSDNNNPDMAIDACASAMDRRIEAGRRVIPNLFISTQDEPTEVVTL